MLESRGGRSRGFRRIGFALGAALLAWLGIEIVAMGLHLIANGDPYPKSTLKREMKAAVRGLPGAAPVAVGGGGLAWNAEDLDWGDLIEVIHPYLGFVLDADRNVPPVADTGFFAVRSRDEPLPMRREGAVVVGVFGGSFASGVGHQVERVFAGCPALEGREVEARIVALGGYKQPQQLMALAYLMSLGAEFDLVLNVDGFNEVALPLVENVANGVHPHHPRMWHLRAGTVMDPENARALGRVELVRDTRDRWARFFLDSKLYRSPILALVWQLGDATASRWGRIDEAQLSVDGTGDGADPATVPPVLRGPRWAGTGAPEAEAMSLLADHWARTSRQMRALSEASGARYVHGLQPNQYVPGSKPMSASERSVAIGEGPFADAVRLGYPMLIERGATLHASGVEFLDLTPVFAAHEDPLYVDDCCHVDAGGYALVAEAICNAL